MKLGNNDRLVLIGDSITDCDREYPVGGMAGLGGGYVAQIWALLQAVYPERRIRVLNTGVSGNRVTDLAERWQTDVIDLEPDWVSIMIGINDVWRHFDRGGYMDAQVDIKTYQTTLSDLVAQTLPEVKGMVVVTPYYLETNRNDPMRAMMDEYGAAAKAVAREHDTVLVDLQSAFDRFLQEQPTQILCGDRVHPNAAGHMIIARAVLNGLEFDWGSQDG